MRSDRDTGTPFNEQLVLEADSYVGTNHSPFPLSLLSRPGQFRDCVHGRLVDDFFP